MNKVFSVLAGLILICLAYLAYPSAVEPVLQVASGSDNSDNGNGSDYGEWTFAVMCDTRGDNSDTMDKSGINDTIISALVKDIVTQRCDLVLFPGDMVNGWSHNGTTTYAEQFANWRDAMGPVYSAGIEVYPIRGNHENGGEKERAPWPPVYPYPCLPASDPALKAAFIKAFNDSYIPMNGPEGEKGLTYSFAYKNAFFIGLDEYVNPHKVNQAWLDEQLKGNNRSHIFVFGHEPAIRVAHPDCLAYYPAERDAMWNSIARAGGRMYFCGHDHLYDMCHMKAANGEDIHQAIVGSCGAPLWNATNPYPEGEKVIGEYRNCNLTGYMLVTINGNHVMTEWRAMRNSGWETMDVMEYDL